MKKMIKGLYISVLGVVAMTAYTSVQAGPGAEERIREVVSQVLPGTKVEHVEATPLSNGLYEVHLGAEIYYFSGDGRYLIKGDIIDLQTQTNLTDAKRGEARLTALASVPESSMIVYPAKGQSKHTLSIFTDIDCGYCRKLHGEMSELNELGITVRYLAFPRAGVDSISYQKAVSVWCAADRRKAMDKAKNGDMPEQKSCDNPVMSHMQLGETVGVTGTPALVLEDGTLVPGYLPAQRMLKLLDSRKQGS